MLRQASASHTGRMATQLDGSPAARPLRRLLAVPPGWPFHLLCGVPAVAMLWGASGPTTTWWKLGGAAGALVLAALWTVRLIAHRWVRGAGGRQFVIAPAGGVLLVLSVPLQARWTFAQHEFDRAVRSLPAAASAGEQSWVEVRGRIGGYRVSRIEPVAGGVLFHSPAPCGFLNDAGFGWFPDGPDPAALDTAASRTRASGTSGALGTRGAQAGEGRAKPGRRRHSQSTASTCWSFP
jgi:hypothetical protein